MENKPTKQSRSKAIVMVGLGLSLVFLWLALREVDFGDVARSFGTARLWLAAPILASLWIYYWLKAVRWRYLLAPRKAIPTGALMPPMMIGLAGNNLLPAHLGELFRMYLLARQENIAKSTVLATLVVERVLDMICVLALAAIGIIGGNFGNELKAAGAFLAGVAACGLGLIVLMNHSRRAFDALIWPFMRVLPDSLETKIRRQLDFVVEGFASLRSWRDIPRLLINSLLQWTLMSLAIYLAMLAFNVDAQPVAAFVVLALVVAGITLPGSPGFFGTVEYCFVLGLGFYGIEASTALSVAIFYHLLTWSSATLLGLYYLRRLGMNWSTLKGAAGETSGA
jgi:uncharacterized protein (TIRG00374 family)